MVEVSESQKHEIAAWLKSRGYSIRWDDPLEDFIVMMWQELIELGATVNE